MSNSDEDETPQTAAQDDISFSDDEDDVPDIKTTKLSSNTNKIIDEEDKVDSAVLNDEDDFDEDQLLRDDDDVDDKEKDSEEEPDDDDDLDKDSDEDEERVKGKSKPKRKLSQDNKKKKRFTNLFPVFFYFLNFVSAKRERVQ